MKTKDKPKVRNPSKIREIIKKVLAWIGISVALLSCALPSFAAFDFIEGTQGIEIYQAQFLPFTKSRGIAVSNYSITGGVANNYTTYHTIHDAGIVDGMYPQNVTVYTAESFYAGKYINPLTGTQTDDKLWLTEYALTPVDDGTDLLFTLYDIPVHYDNYYADSDASHGLYGKISVDIEGENAASTTVIRVYVRGYTVTGANNAMPTKTEYTNEYFLAGTNSYNSNTNTTHCTYSLSNVVRAFINSEANNPSILAREITEIYIDKTYLNPVTDVTYEGYSKIIDEDADYIPVVSIENRLTTRILPPEPTPDSEEVDLTVIGTMLGTAVDGFLSLEIGYGITLAGIFLAVVALLVVFAFLHYFAGG